MPDKKGTSALLFPCDGPGRSGTCQTLLGSSLLPNTCSDVNNWVTLLALEALGIWQGTVAQFNESSYLPHGLAARLPPGCTLPKRSTATRPTARNNPVRLVLDVPIRVYGATGL